MKNQKFETLEEVFKGMSDSDLVLMAQDFGMSMKSWTRDDTEEFFRDLADDAEIVCDHNAPTLVDEINDSEFVK
jgi:hypothetical protein